jgi:hypothetical protein
MAKNCYSAKLAAEIFLRGIVGLAVDSAVRPHPVAAIDVRDWFHVGATPL